VSLRTLGFVIAAVAICATACGKGETETKRDLTQREKDSILGALHDSGRESSEESDDVGGFRNSAAIATRFSRTRAVM